MPAMQYFVLMIDWGNVIGAFLIMMIVGCLMVYNWTWCIGLFWVVQPIITPLVYYNLMFSMDNDLTAWSLGSTIIVWILSSILNIKTGNMVTDLNDWWVDKRGCIINKILKHDKYKRIKVRELR